MADPAARTRRPPPDDFLLSPWGELSPEERASAFRRKWSWVTAAPESRPVWYATVLGNLHRRSVSLDEATMDAVRDALSEGLSRAAFERLKAVIDTSADELCRVVAIPPRTLARRDRFKPDESERILRVASVFQRTLDVLGDLDKARRWFATPKRALGDRTPFAFCDTGPGAEQVTDLLGRIEHGVFT